MDVDEDDADRATGIPEQLEVQRTRMIVGPEINYHVRALCDKVPRSTLRSLVHFVVP
jgi:hypothetical protein